MLALKAEYAQRKTSEDEGCIYRSVLNDERQKESLERALICISYL
jgi:hypothetical protein